MEPSTSEGPCDSSKETVAVEKQLCVSRVESYYLDSSDIERISTDDDDDELGSFSLLLESINSSVSAPSLIYKQEAGIETDEAKSDVSWPEPSSSSSSSLLSDDQLPCEETVVATTTDRIHSYIHTPNRKLNLNLNFLVVVSIATVVGLGVGHFLGYSSQVLIKKQQISDSVVSNDTSNARPPVLFEKLEQLKDTAFKIFAENELLQTALDKANIEIDKYSQQGFLTQEDKATNALLSEYRRLKLHLIMQQLENVDILKNMEFLKDAELDKLKRLLHYDGNFKVDGGNENVQATNAEVHEKNDSAPQPSMNLEPSRSNASNESSESGLLETMDLLTEMNTTKQELRDLELQNSKLHSLVAQLQNEELQRLELSEPEGYISAADESDERIEPNNTADVKHVAAAAADSHEREIRMEQIQSKLCNETALEGKNSVQNVLQMVVCILAGKLVKEESPTQSDVNERLLKLITDLLENDNGNDDRLTAAGHGASKLRNIEKEQFERRESTQKSNKRDARLPRQSAEKKKTKKQNQKKVEMTRSKVKQKTAKKDGDGDSWMFKRAQSRDKKRKEQQRFQSGYNSDKVRRDRKRDRRFDTKYHTNKFQRNGTSKSKKQKGRYTEESSYDSDRVEKKQESRETWDSSSGKLRRDRLELNLKHHSHFSSH